MMSSGEWLWDLPVATKIAPEIKARMKRVADARHRTPHRMMRETFRQDAIKAWDEYQTTGLYVTMEEADAWLANLEDGKDVEPPECHV